MQERHTTYDLKTSADRFSDLLPSIQPLEPARDGYRILSIGEGPSDFVAKLLRSGYDATAIDLGYVDGVHSLADVTKKAYRNVKRQDYHRVCESTRNFTDATKAFPGRFIAALGAELPFADSQFDRVVSFASLGLHFRDDMLETSLEEAIRVTKPSGSLEIVPYLQAEDSSYDELSKVDHQLVLVPWLVSNPKVDTVTLSEVPWRGIEVIKLSVKTKKS